MSLSTLTQKPNVLTKCGANRCYKTEIKILANTWLESRQVWKAKYMLTKEKIVSLKNEILNLSESRNLYKQKNAKSKKDFHEANRQYRKKNETNEALKNSIKDKDIQIEKFEEIIKEKTNDINRLNGLLESLNLTLNDVVTDSKDIKQNLVGKTEKKTSKNL